MAIYYWQRYSDQLGSRNFGDDINPFLLGKIFSKELIENDDVCIVGIGTILNQYNAGKLAGYGRKIIFSSGAGYGDGDLRLDPSWTVSCVRGPKTAETLGVDPALAVTDGAILLSDFFDPLPEGRRQGVVFTPHVNTHWAIGKVLERVCGGLGVKYVVPDLPAEDFIREISSARLVVAEAMHGAILADTMRVPWTACHIMFHNSFKWQDWCASLGLAYRPAYLGSGAADLVFEKILHLPEAFAKKLQGGTIRKALERLTQGEDTQLSAEETWETRKKTLWQKAAEINADYA